MRVSTREFFGDVEALTESALAEPLSITRDGEDRFVLLSAEEYERLRSHRRRVVMTTDWTDEELEALAKVEMPPEYDYLNAELEDWRP